MPVLPDGPEIEFIYPSFQFGTDIVTEIPPTPFMVYTGGTAIAASGYSSYLGQVIFQRDIQPVNACSGQVGPIKTRNPINFAG